MPLASRHGNSKGWRRNCASPSACFASKYERTTHILRCTKCTADQDHTPSTRRRACNRRRKALALAQYSLKAFTSGWPKITPNSWGSRHPWRWFAGSTSRWVICRCAGCTRVGCCDSQLLCNHRRPTSVPREKANEPWCFCTSRRLRPTTNS